MRLRIRHDMHFRFGEPARSVTHILRLTPRSHEGQHVIGWRIDVDTDCTLKAGEDGFGNITHTFTARGPCEALTISVAGEIENFDAAGVVRGSAERLPTELFLRDTPLTVANAEVRAFADASVSPDAAQIEKLHALMGAIHARLGFDPERAAAASPAITLGAKTGTAADHAHLFVACVRHLGYPARVVSGYYWCRDRSVVSRHDWGEVFVVGLGWVGFDTANDVCPQEGHVRIAAGLDGLSTATVRGTHTGGLVEKLDVVPSYENPAVRRPGGSPA